MPEVCDKMPALLLALFVSGSVTWKGMKNADPGRRWTEELYLWWAVLTVLGQSYFLMAVEVAAPIVVLWGTAVGAAVAALVFRRLGTLRPTRLATTHPSNAEPATLEER